ncbi:uncharacterized protein Dvar_02170 [Desulfosarcina variabilis str. Montpellier]
MTIFAIVLVVLSAAMHAGRNYLTKKAGDKQAFVWWYEIVQKKRSLRLGHSQSDLWCTRLSKAFHRF